MPGCEAMTEGNGRWKKLVLFDIDGTLIKPGFSRHGRAFEAAVKRLTGREILLKDVDTLGQIDNNIILQMLRLAGLAPREAELSLETMRRIMEEVYLADEIDLRPHVLPGVLRLLSSLQERDEILPGLLTGNLEPIARHKLMKAGLGRYFRVGGFGNEGRERFELVDVVRRKCLERHGRDFRGGEIVRIGDTPRDIECGLRNGALTMGVSTGAFSREQLMDAGADLVLNDFTEIQTVEEARLGLERLISGAGTDC